MEIELKTIKNKPNDNELEKLKEQETKDLRKLLLALIEVGRCLNINMDFYEPETEPPEEINISFEKDKIKESKSYNLLLLNEEFDLTMNIMLNIPIINKHKARFDMCEIVICENGKCVICSAMLKVN